MKLSFLLILLGVGLCLIGIDIGSKYIKIALEELGNGDRIIENEMSKRKTENSLSLCTDGLFIGE